jgi:hypothetical protein
MKKELLRALDAALQEPAKAPDVLKLTRWPRGEMHLGKAHQGQARWEQKVRLNQTSRSLRLCCNFHGPC